MHVFKSTFIFLAAVGAIAGASTGPLGCGPTHPHGYCAEVTAWDPSRETGRLRMHSPKQTDYTASFSNDVTLPEPAGVASRILTSTSAP
ncbi:hypothetical protein H4Q26_014515 [Puccinia striiformis f. sp. tritici PST-130]|nr:hypothetical protein H4Q26_014515 [Puccinia striiformis f. sp. tritici PST-130]